MQTSWMSVLSGLLLVIFLGAAVRAQKAELVVQTGHTKFIYTIGFSPDGKTIATGGVDNAVKLWDVSSGKELRTLPGFAASFSPKGEILAVSDSYNIKLWNYRTTQEVQTLEDSSGAQLIDFSPNGEVVTGLTTVNDTIELWDTVTGKRVRTLAGHVQPVNVVKFSSDGKTLISSSSDRTTKLWDWHTGEQLKSITGSDHDSLNSIAISPNGELMAVLVIGRGIVLRKLTTGNEMAQLSGNFAFGSARMAFSPDSKMIVVVDDPFSPQSTAHVFDVLTGHDLKQIGLKDESYSLGFSSDSKLLAIGGTNSANLWNISTGEHLATLVGHAAPINVMALSPDGNLLVSGSTDHSIKVWDFQQGRQIKVFEGHLAEIERVAFSTDGRTLASGSADKIIKLWDVDTGRELKSLFVKDPDTQRQVLALVPSYYRHNEETIRTSDRALELRNESHFQGRSGNLGIFSANSDKILLSLISLDRNEWAVTTPEGLFDGSPGARKLMHFVMGLDTVALDQMKDAYYVPGLLKKVLSGEPLPGRGLFSRQDLFPQIDLELSHASRSLLNVNLKNRGGGIGQVQILFNGKEFIADARPTGLDPNAPTASITVDLSGAPVKSGEENKVAVVARNLSGTLSTRGSREAEITYLDDGRRQVDTPHIYAIVGGISRYTGDSLRLKFAAKDAQDFAHALELGAVRLLGDQRKVHVRLLVSKSADLKVQTKLSDFRVSDATKTNFEKAFADFRDATPNDVFIVYLAGHGISIKLNQNLTHAGGDTYLYITQEGISTEAVMMSESSRRAMTISSEELKELMKQNKALKQVLILDTCAAATLSNSFIEKRDLPSDQIRAVEMLKDSTGFFVLMGSSADAFSYETNQYGQGLLTYSLLQGMKGAGLKQNQFADVSRLFSYAQETVPQMARSIGGIQRPVIITPELSSDFPIGQFTVDEQKLISLPSPRPLILHPSLRNADPKIRIDNLNLTQMLTDQLRQESYIKPGGEPARIVFVETDAMADALQPVGDYAVERGQLVITLILVQNNVPIGREIRVTGNADEPAKVIKRVAQAIVQSLPEK